MRTRLNFLWLELTSVCNLRCIHCYGAFGEPNPVQELGLSEWKRVLSEAHGLGCRQVQFTGGEALLSPHLPALVETAKRIGYEFLEIFTNATKIGEEEVRLFRKHGVFLAVSVYSNQEEIHDSITGIPGSFRATEEALKQLKRAGVPFRVAVILMRKNQDALEGMAKWMEQIGAYNAFRVDPVRSAGRGNDPALQPDRFPAGAGRDRVFYPGHPLRSTSAPTTCWKGKITVTASGLVLPCIFARDLVCGDLSRETLTQTIDGSRLRELWDLTVRDVPECHDCAMQALCADCRYLAFSETGNLKGRNPRCPKNAMKSHRPAMGVGMTERTPGTVPGRSAEVVTRRIGDEILLYNHRTHRTHLLNPSAAILWDSLDGRRSPDDLARILADTFDTSDTEIRSDIDTLLNRLARSGLILWRPENVSRIT